MDASAWSSQQLSEFIAVVSTVDNPATVARVAVERAALAFDAEAAAIVRGGELLASVGYPEGRAPVAELAAVRPGDGEAWLDVPGVGRCAAAAAALSQPSGATLVIARPGPGPLSRAETGLLRGLARVAEVTTRLLTALADERAAGEEVERLAREQAALRRVATLVAEAADPEEVFCAVAEELARVSGADTAHLFRLEPDSTVTVVGGWSEQGIHIPSGKRLDVAAVPVVHTVLRTRRPARTLGSDGSPGSVPHGPRRTGVGSPIMVDGRLWGALTTGSARPGWLCPEVERRIPPFAELVATAIGNTQVRTELHRIVEEQAALRRVATLVARGVLPGDVFAAVAEEVGRLLPADLTLIGRYGPGPTATGVGGWSRTGDVSPLRGPVPLGGRNVMTRVFETGQPARMNSYPEGPGAACAEGRDRGFSASVGAPIRVDGRVWGLIIVASGQDGPLPPGTEDRLAGFTELVATAIANAQARAELSALAVEQAALRRVAVLVARGAPPPEVFAAVTAEVGRVVPADVALLIRFDPDGHLTSVGAWTRSGEALATGRRAPMGGHNVSTLVWQTGRAARVDSYGEDPGPVVAALTGSTAWRSGAGAPIRVGGRLWGVVTVASTIERPLPADTEARLAGFTELVGTAVANAEAHAELTASRARIVATADQTRRRIERDLHDGAQQRLVSLALQLQAVKAAVPADLADVGTELEEAVAGLTGALDELREYARGIHPVILSEAGLAAALRTLARRCPIPVDLDIPAGPRLPDLVEATAYYVAAEALTNAAKYSGASAVRVIAGVDDGLLQISVEDDGVGGADPAAGTGLVGLKDRAEAIGGTLVVRSHPGEGTCVTARLPLDPR